MHGNYRSAYGGVFFALASTLALAGCGALSGGLSDVAAGDVKVPNTTSWFSRPSWASVSTATTARREITSNDLLAADGSCAGAAVAASEPAGGEGGIAPATASLVPGGIAVDMTECEVVQRAGQPDDFQIGNNERGERSVVLTYARGPKPGIYRFVAGRLAAMERGAEPPQAAKPAKPAKKPTTPARTPRPT